ncbi:MAG: hypothetical protein K5891_07470 [Lachnospiraceae bacterium]|nr:hypothetical protein [Lachnospiraceae bacterium]
MPEYEGKGRRIPWERVLTAAALALIPWISVLISLAADHRGLQDVSLIASEWNDELFYYKMTEGVVNCGIPRGFFGFNESTAQYLSFASWSPVILLPWILWGKLFGWGLLSPILCNLVFLSISLFAYGWMVRPRWMQALLFGVLYCSFGFFSRFTLSAMPEMNLIALLVLYMAFVTVGAGRDGKDRHAVGAMLTAALLTWMRPYYLLLLIYPLYLILRKKRSAFRIAISAMAVLFTVIVYALIGKFLSAPYLEDLYYTDWIKGFSGGLGAGIAGTYHQLRNALSQVLALCRTALAGGGGYGRQYFSFLVVLFLEAASCICSLVLCILARKKGAATATSEEIAAQDQAAGGQGAVKDTVAGGQAAGQDDRAAFRLGLQLQILLLNAGFFGADLLMYRIPQGGRHTLALIAAVLLCFVSVDAGDHTAPESGTDAAHDSQTVPETDKAQDGKALPAKLRKYLPSAVVTLVLIAAFLPMTVIRAKEADPYLFAVPYARPVTDRGPAAAPAEGIIRNYLVHFTEYEDLEEELSALPSVDKSQLSFDNTVIWMISDHTGEDLTIQRWQLYYALPAGYGINLCTADYVAEHFAQLRSGYIGVIPGSDTEMRCREAGYEVIASVADLVIYRLH